LEQERIAAKLSEQAAAVERARVAAEAQRDAAEALPAVYLREAFNTPEASSWARERLGTIAEIVSGIQKSPDRAPAKFHRPYLTVRNVQRGYLDVSQVERFEVTPEELQRLRLLPGDILIVEGNGSLDHIGRNAMFVGDGEEWIHQNHIIRVRVTRTVATPEFVSAFLNSDQGRSQIVEKAKTTSGLYTLSTGKVASLDVLLPPLCEQKRVTARLIAQLNAAERVAQRVSEQLDAINTLPAALLRQAFSGEL
jgi:type I restriction enzyme S subunit